MEQDNPDSHQPPPLSSPSHCLTVSPSHSSTSHSSTDGIAAIVRNYRQRKGLSLQALADQVGCAKSYLSSIENDRRPGPPGDDLLRALETALGIDPGRLIQAARWQATPDTVRAEVERMRGLLRAGGAAGVGGLDRWFKSGALHRLVQDSAAQDPAPRTQDPPLVALPHEVPLINKVAAGYPRDFTDLAYPARVADEYIRCPDLSDADAFAARVVGDSMSPQYIEGDIVVFSPARPIVTGMDCFARLEPDHETTFKRVYFETTPTGDQLIRLQPLNSAYAPRTLPREAVAGLYAAVSVMRRV